MNIKNVFITFACLACLTPLIAKDMVNCSTKKELDALLKKNSMAIVDFHGERFCFPCKKMSPIFADLAKTYDSVQFVKIDIETSASEFPAVKSVPTFVFYKNGVEVKRFTGVKTPAEFKSIITSSFGI